MELTNDFLQFAYFSLTSDQQDKIKVKYHIANNMDKSVQELQDDILKLDLNYKYIRSDDRIRKIKKYEIPLIVDFID